VRRRLDHGYLDGRRRVQPAYAEPSKLRVPQPGADESGPGGGDHDHDAIHDLHETAEVAGRFGGHHIRNRGYPRDGRRGLRGRGQ
jgi:hypothetical protein